MTLTTGLENKEYLELDGEQMPRRTAVHSVLRQEERTDASSSLVSSAAAVTNSSTTERLFFSDPALIVLLSIALPIVIICLFLLFFYCCCHHRTKGSHSSTFTRAKEASHLSSPLHSTHQAILSSSSSSTNTRVTNVSVRQTLLNKTSSHLSKEMNILCEISAEKIRFLQEIGEGIVQSMTSMKSLCSSSGEFGRIYLGEFIDTNERCVVKTLQTESGTEDYLQEIESRHQASSSTRSFTSVFSFSTSASYEHLLFGGNLHSISRNLLLSDL